MANTDLNLVGGDIVKETYPELKLKSSFILYVFIRKVLYYMRVRVLTFWILTVGAPFKFSLKFVDFYCTINYNHCLMNDFL